MRILISTSPGVGHLLPLLPLARAARGRGHDVRIAAGASLASIAANAGFPHFVAGPPSLGAVAREIPALEGLTGRRRAVVMVREGFAGSIAGGIATDLLAAFGEADARDPWRPDLIVHEDMELGSWIVAERLGIPHATVQVTAWRPLVRALVATSIEPLRLEHGLADDATDRLLGSVFFTTRPASMHGPDAPLPEMTAELRPIADDRDATPQDAGDPVDIDAFPAGDGPRIAVTLGTVNADQHDVLRALVEGAAASADGRTRVVVALGGDPDRFGAVPSNVDVRAYVPMSTLLPWADLVVFHGGSGTLTAALAAARPMLVVPLAADQPDNADRAVAAGVAHVIGLDGLTADGVRVAIDAALGDPDLARRATEIAAEIAAMPGPEAAVDRLESIVAGR